MLTGAIFASRQDRPPKTVGGPAFLGAVDVHSYERPVFLDLDGNIVCNYKRPIFEAGGVNGHLFEQLSSARNTPLGKHYDKTRYYPA
jgi:hypothetical protein